MNPLLRVDGLTKTFDGLMAVRQVSLELAEGEILGLTGPNGAGKTTLFNMISGRYQPTAGRITATPTRRSPPSSKRCPEPAHPPSPQRSAKQKACGPTIVVTTIRARTLRGEERNKGQMNGPCFRER